MLTRGGSAAEILVIEKFSKYKVLIVLINANHEIKPKRRHYWKLQVDEFWTYIGDKQNKVWLIYAYDLDNQWACRFYMVQT